MNPFLFEICKFHHNFLPVRFSFGQRHNTKIAHLTMKINEIKKGCNKTAINQQSHVFMTYTHTHTNIYRFIFGNFYKLCHVKILWHNKGKSMRVNCFPKKKNMKSMSWGNTKNTHPSPGIIACIVPTRFHRASCQFVPTESRYSIHS